MSTDAKTATFTKDTNNNLSDNLLYYSDGTNWIQSPEIVNGIITSWTP